MDESHPSLSSLVDLRQQDFTKGVGDAIVKAAQVTFFNNFGPWFDPLMATYNNQVQYNSTYCAIQCSTEHQHAQCNAVQCSAAQCSAYNVE